MNTLRRLGPVGVVLAVIVVLVLGVSAQSVAPSGPTMTQFNALVARVTSLESRVTQLEAAATASPSPSPSPTATTSPSPTTTATTSPTSTPAPSSYPDASTTGVPAGTTLTAYTGPSRITTAGTVITGKTLGCVEIAAGGVTFRNSRITCPAGIAVTINDRGFTGTPALLEDVEITCQDGNGTAVSEAHFVLRRVDIHGCENGVDANQDITVEDSYIHDLFNGGEAHMDGIQLAWHWDGTAYVCCAKDITIRHNTIYGVDPTGAFGTSAIISNPGADENILIANNLLAGGAATVYCNRPGKGVNYRLLDNHFSTKFGPKVGYYFPSTECSDETQSGNVIHETGQPITLE